MVRFTAVKLTCSAVLEAVPVGLVGSSRFKSKLFKKSKVKKKALKNNKMSYPASSDACCMRLVT